MSDLAWIISKTSSVLKLDDREVRGLHKLLWRNYLRDIAAVEYFLGHQHQAELILHPVILDALRLTVAERRDLIDEQGRLDKPSKVVSPHFFNHGPVFVHRIWVPGVDVVKQLAKGARDAMMKAELNIPMELVRLSRWSPPAEFGIAIQTIVVDVSDRISYSLFTEMLSCQTQIPISQLRVFVQVASNMVDEYQPGLNPPIAERMDWPADILEMRQKMFLMPPRSDLNLSSLRIGPGSEIFVVNTGHSDIDILCLEGIMRAWAGDADFVSKCNRIPLPEELYLQLQDNYNRRSTKREERSHSRKRR